MRYVLGLDLGIASIGWAIYDIDKSTIEKCGVRLFDAAENPKTKESLATPRRLARGQRRRIRRRAYRMEKIKEYLIQSGLLTQDELAKLFISPEKTPSKSSRYDVYELRYQALDHQLTNTQLAQILIHLAKHRGFKSNRKNDKSVDGKINNKLKENHQLLIDKSYRSIGEMLYKDDDFSTNRRNRFGEYRVMLQRTDIEDEARIILERQQQLGNELISTGFIEHYLKMFNWQKSFDWRGNIIEMVGSCQFEKAEKRAPKACFSSEKFIALSKLNNIYYTLDSIEHWLSQSEIKHIYDLAIARKTKSFNITFADIRKALDISDEARFNFVKYNSNNDFLECEKKEKIKELEFKAYHELKTSISNHIGDVTWSNLSSNVALIDEIAISLTYNKTDETISAALAKSFTKHPHNFQIEEQTLIISALLDDGISFDKNISLSLLALYKIIPFLELGQRYDEACASAGYNHSAQQSQRNIKLPTIQALGLDQELTNPVVIRAISQVRKVINAIIAIYGSPYQINIELARDIGKTAQQRNEISKFQKENKASNEKMVAQFTEYFKRHPAKDELTKYKLWKQQNGHCIYSGESINLDEIRHGVNLTQIDHIIPFSRSFDDSLSNKVLCLTAENQRKGNQTPYEYIAEQKWHTFEEHCENLLKHGRQAGFSYKKYQLLLTKKFDQDKFIERNLNDTRYISSFCKNYLENNLHFAELGDKNKRRVRVLTGQATAFIRSHWGLAKSREENDLHHAQDACVIAAVTTSMQQRITAFMQAKSYGKNQDATYTDPESGEVFDRFPMPNINFRTQLLQKVNQVFVSRMPKRTVTGQVHLDTIRSKRYVDNPVAEYNNGKPFSTISKRLSESGIKLDKDDEIPTLCPTYKQHNPNIYKLLKERLEKHDNDAKKAFAKPLLAPRKDGTPSEHQIKTIKVIQAQNTGVEVNHGIADNGGMVRIDIFTKDGKNYIVPVYLSG
ncbi:MAG: type II CRISPR RNA-guided endonuclease Cas9 [Burkholderiales bacterium]|nr:type II CRISPR RNA-guided endonuclease Cas9 [Burkholderiales bacterium]